jgi:putative transposase
VALGKGEKVPEVCKQLEISVQTFYRWRTKYGISCRRYRRRTRGSNAWVADQTLDNQILRKDRPPKLVRPERRRRTAESVRRRLGLQQVSQRRICRVLGQSRSTPRYRLFAIRRG